MIAHIQLIFSGLTCGEYPGTYDENSVGVAPERWRKYQENEKTPRVARRFPMS